MTAPKAGFETSEYGWGHGGGMYKVFCGQTDLNIFHCNYISASFNERFLLPFVN